jgi:hypothetical protein
MYWSVDRCSRAGANTLCLLLLVNKMANMNTKGLRPYHGLGILYDGHQKSGTSWVMLMASPSAFILDCLSCSQG